MKLWNILKLYKGCRVSITGAGGKTSLMFTIAEELRNEYKVLVTTTTKIFIPERDQYDFIHMLKACDDHYVSSIDSGIYVLGESFREEGKITGLNCEQLEELSQYFHITLIEADGSKRKPLKGWKENEPVICEGTSKTIGVLDIKTIGMIINDDNIHRLSRFLNITDTSEGERVDVENLVSLIFHKEGLFKDSRGERILYISKVETENDRRNLKLLLNCINERNNGYISNIISGSIREKHFHAQV
jgi:probable selenium-dependent hydroxylase accessory protein YqeC